MSAKQDILARLRAARAGVRLPRVEAGALAPPAETPPDACLLRFEVEATALGVECYVESSVAAVHARLAALVKGRRVLSWDASALPYDAGRVLHDVVTGSSSRTEQAAADVGVTGCDAAIAETGSLVMFSAPGRSRTASLLPLVHLALLERAHIHFSMAEVLERYQDRLRTSASCTLITGPSRTADIELTLTLGIHGPGRVAVIVGP